MDRAARLIAGLLLAFVAHGAAAFPATATVETLPAAEACRWTHAVNGNTASFDSPRAAADHAIAGRLYSDGSVFREWSSSCGSSQPAPTCTSTHGSSFSVTRPNGACSQASDHFVTKLNGQCPSGWTLSGGQCQRTVYSCPSPFVLVGQSCEPADCPEGQLFSQVDGCVCPETAIDLQALGVGEVVSEGTARPSDTPCMLGCRLRVRWSVMSGGKWYGDAYGGTGETCTPPAQPPTPSEPQDSAETDCRRRGGVWGSVNGVGVCLPQPAAPGTTGVNLGDSTSSTTNPDGSRSETTVDRVRTCTDGVCTTTTTTTTTTFNAGGTATGSTSTTTTETGTGGGGGGGGNGNGDGVESGFGGTCAAGFVCEGDAVVCAIAREQHVRNCQLWEPRGNLTTADAEQLVNQAKAREGLPDDLIPEEQIEAGTLNTTARLNAGACPSPTVINTPLGVVTVDLTVLCPYLEALGAIILLASIIVAARITVGGIF